jgi:nucleoside-diphosphate-sugar epimerase
MAAGAAHELSTPLGTVALAAKELERALTRSEHAQDAELVAELLSDCDHFLAGAAMIGGISYFHSFAYDLLATNERIVAAACDAAVRAHAAGRLQKVTYMSSSMVFESATEFPSFEGQELRIPPPGSSYGFQKLAVEYFARAAHEQYGLPYTIARPFNLAMSHVVPDLVQKVVKGQDPLRILGSGEQVRHYTYGGDLAEGIAVAIEHPDALNEDFNISTETSTTVLELAEKIWARLRPDAAFRYESDPPFEHDVQRRVPSVEKARRVLGFEARTSLDEMLDEVVPWIENAVREGVI